MSELKKTLKNDDFDKVKVIAHNLKSTVGYAGLSEELFPFLENIEKNAKAGLNGSLADFEIIENKCTLAIKEIKIWLNTHHYLNK